MIIWVIRHSLVSDPMTKDEMVEFSSFEEALEAASKHEECYMLEYEKDKCGCLRFLSKVLVVGGKVVE